MSKRFVKSGFTLIELLVVVAIIALLISILLPSLRDAREQAKVAKCLSNLRSTNVATVTYLLDFNDNFPFMYPGAGPCSWTFGGKTNRNEWIGEPFYIPAKLRPMNRYLLGQEPEPDLMEGNTVIVRTEIPVLSCPGDKNSHQFDYWGENNEGEGISSYDDVGTSYHYNFHSIYGGPNYTAEWGSDGGPDDPNPPSWNEYGNQLVKEVQRKHSSTFLMFIDDELDFAFRDMKPVIGMHGKFNKHTLGFLDGHASYMVADSRRYRGTGWSVVNPEWIRSPGQPFPQIVYQPWQKMYNMCNPVPGN